VHGYRIYMPVYLCLGLYTVLQPVVYVCVCVCVCVFVCVCVCVHAYE